MKRFKNGVTRYDSADLAAAFGYPDPGTKCANCPHKRYRHHRTIVNPGSMDGVEIHGTCEKRDRRTKTGYCKCSQFIEPANEHATDHLKENA